MEEGQIASWLKKEGDFVKEGDAIVEIETDKATMEYNSPEKGTLLKILVNSGETCALNAPIAVLGKEGEKFDIASLTKGVSPPAGHDAKAAGHDAKAAGHDAKAAGHDAKAAGHDAIARHPERSEGSGRTKASPLAKKIAAEHQLNLSQIAGSGPGGRIVLRDVEGALKQPGGAPATKAPTAVTEGDKISIPLSMMRKTIAKRLLAGKNEAPHFYLTVSANMEKSMAWRVRLNENQKDVKVSVNDIIVLAVTKALQKHPEVNASWAENSITQYRTVHLALAVALDSGLVTPVIRNAHTLGATQIAKQSKLLIEKARGGSLTPEDYQGGTFTISNLGMMGIEEFTAIINPPQAAILAVGAVKPQPWVNDKGEIVAEIRTKLTMSCDHRVIDGAMGAKFLQTLVSYLEDPLMMLG
jgi:pyruvate dehydrogenase E2 component (dihydrolipoamide acetyltransferase)